MVPVHDWQLTADVESAVPDASVPAVPAKVGEPVVPPVQVIVSAEAGIDAPPEPVIAAPVSDTDVPPVSFLVERKLPASVAVFVQATAPDTVAPTAHEMLLPALYVTPMVAWVAAVTATVTVAVFEAAAAGAASRPIPRAAAEKPARMRETIWNTVLHEGERE
jgi:hypothetical protein